jgi:hypothetical protein
MTERKPPAIAAWLLDKLGYTRHNAALTGDMLEEFHSGRSSAWYWRQAVLIVARRLGREAFSPDALFGVGFAFLFFALPDCVFWWLNRPSDIDKGVSGLVSVAFLLLMFSLLKMPRVSGRLLVVVGIAWVWFDAWNRKDPLASRLDLDAEFTVTSWVFATVHACWTRSRLSKPR